MTLAASVIQLFLIVQLCHVVFAKEGEKYEFHSQATLAALVVVLVALLRALARGV